MQILKHTNFFHQNLQMQMFSYQNTHLSSWKHKYSHQNIFFLIKTQIFS
jgi:hypothetical protein